MTIEPFINFIHQMRDIHGRVRTISDLTSLASENPKSASPENLDHLSQAMISFVWPKVIK